MREAVIVEAVRTPTGRGRTDGALSAWHPVDLLARTLQELVERAGIDPERVDDVVAVAGDDPIMMLTGVVPATEMALQRSGLRIDDIDLFEVNEAFAPVVLAWQAETKADLDRVNVNGGAIALGHPLGASGVRLMTTLVHELERREERYGLQTMCEGGGMANATILERVS